MIGYGSGGIPDAQLHVTGRMQANSNLPLQVQIGGVVCLKRPHYRQALVVRGERAPGIASLRLDVADAIDADREVALPCRVAGFLLSKPPHNAERLLILRQGCCSITAFEIDGTQLV